MKPLCLVLMAWFSCAACVAAPPREFTRLDKMCGDIRDITNGQTIQSMRFDVFKISDPDQECCWGAKLVTVFVTNKRGEFFVKSARKGYYYFVAPTSPRIFVPIEIIEDYSGGACSERPSIHVNIKTGTATIFVVLE